MRNKNTKADKTKVSSGNKKSKVQSSEYETMSQPQNRHVKGREQNGSDGSSNGGRGSNH
jgi:hypothetical protein